MEYSNVLASQVAYKLLTRFLNQVLIVFNIDKYEQTYGSTQFCFCLYAITANYLMDRKTIDEVHQMLKFQHFLSRCTFDPCLFTHSVARKSVSISILGCCDLPLLFIQLYFPSKFHREQDVSIKTFRQKKTRDVSANFSTINVGMMQSIKRASDMSPFPLVHRGPLGPLICPSC